MTADSVAAELLEIRGRIDQIDRDLLQLLAQRFDLTHHVGRLKASNALDPVDAGREAQKLEALRALCADNGLNPELVTEIFIKIMAEAVRNHNQIRQQHRQ
ncbi:MAG TPA: chorismate mutase [Gammaproteobacteria bacterium]|nr:chorismate mutase [Gammaproteobacteria bacterium]HAT28073.1 chorismate mutase [Gammaproteobacteria bacterium]|tara:strand:- start:4792 stop:5094 length:303 start_codon:yes stop_codon:yes gene_type:complete